MWSRRRSTPLESQSTRSRATLPRCPPKSARWRMSRGTTRSFLRIRSTDVIERTLLSMAIVGLGIAPSRFGYSSSFVLVVASLAACSEFDGLTAREAPDGGSHAVDARAEGSGALDARAEG